LIIEGFIDFQLPPESILDENLGAVKFDLFVATGTGRGWLVARNQFVNRKTVTLLIAFD
jgi:hypothetical protein